MIKQLLSGHTSPETAYLVEDYPYGFRLRCSIRYWLEFSATKGARLVSQTTNPKKNNIWNKPKASTYCRFGGAMYLDENNHVQWKGAHEYMELDALKSFRDECGATMPELMQKVLNNFIKLKEKYEEARKLVNN